MKTNFGKVITAMVTPFDSSGEIDYAKVKELTRFTLERGADGLLVCGTTGESPTLTTDEKLNLFRAVKQEAGVRVPVLANVGSNNTRESVEFARLVEKETDVDGLLAVNPYYNKPDQEGLYQHFKTIAASTSLPIMLYNIPGRTGVNLEADTTIKLSLLDNIVAIKESSGDLDQMAKIIEHTDDTFKLYCGDDNLTLPVYAIGGHGVVSVASHFFGNEIKRMMDNMDAKTHRTLLPFVHSLFSSTNPVPTKSLLTYLGVHTGGPRLPLVDMSAEKKEAVIQSYLEVVRSLK